MTGVQDSCNRNSSFQNAARHIHTHNLLEIRKLQLTVKNLVHKGVDLYVQNALKHTYEAHSTSIFNSKKFLGSYTPDPR